ncbi:MAG: helicase-associated domain-containing protein, partial [Actinomycetota bacterium]|nr:helicase-associated domain-containing protein [Actinomycetota bacterium]
ALGGAPAPALKAGGLGVREAKRVAKAADLPEADAIRLLEIALAADLVVDAVPGHGVAPAPAFDGWMELPPAERWLALVRAWIDTPRWPSLAGQRDLNDKPIPALMPYGHGAAAAAQRRTLLDELARAPSGSSVDPATVVPSVTWEMPGAWETSPASPGRVIEWTLAEARLLGVTGLGALCTAARLLLDGRPDEATEAARHLLPTPSTEITLQADLTCIAPAALEATLRGELGLMADVESSGAATVFRFSETSIRRAVDAGRSGEQLVALLERHAPRGVPQPLTYLVADVARRHGQIRVGEVCSYLRCDDAALVAEVLRTKAKAVSALALRALAPTVLASKATPGELLDALRAAGFLPAREELGGELLLSRAEPHRANPRPPSSARRPVEPSDAELAAAVQALRRGRRDPPSLRDQLLLSRLARGQPPVELFDGTDFDDVNDVDYVDYGAGDEPDDDGLDAEIINFLRRRH